MSNFEDLTVLRMDTYTSAIIDRCERDLSSRAGSIEGQVKLIES